MVLTNIERTFILTLQMSEDEIKEVVSVLEENCDYGAAEDLACNLRMVLESSATPKSENEND